MPVFNAVTGRTAPEELSSTYEGRHLTFYESEVTHPYHSDALLNPKEPINVGGVVGVSFTGAAASTDPMAIDTEGRWVLNVVASNDAGTSPVSPGDDLYVNTGIVSKKSSGVPFGQALSNLSGSATAAACAVKVHSANRYIDPSIIVVSTMGDDSVGKGSWVSPVKTLAGARALLSATRKTIYLLPGDYVETVAFVWPNINGIRIIGLEGQGNVVISGPATTPVITINPTYTAESFEAFLENFVVEHTAQTGIEIDNENMTRKLIVHLKGVGGSQVSTGDSINVTHTTAGQAIRVYARGCDEIEGLVDFVVANADDRIRVYDSVLIGGLTASGAVAGEVTLIGTVIKTGAYTTNAANVITTIGCVYRTDAGVYTQLADAYSA